MPVTVDTARARENARRSDGQFGSQAHTAPELTLDQDHVPVDSAYAELVAASREAKLARVTAAAAHMPEHIRGVRFISDGVDAIPALFHPMTHGGHVTGAGEYKEQHLYPVTAYVTVAPDVLDLEEVMERNGRPAWDWIPAPEQRALPPLFADAAAVEAAQRFQATSEKFRRVAAQHLRTQMPEGVNSITVSYGSEFRGGRYHTVTVPVAAHDSAGALVPLDPHAPEHAHYWETVKRLGFPRGHFPITENDAGGIEYTISREDQS